MKEATGELNMTVVTVVAIAAVGAFFYAFIWPSIKAGLMKNTCTNICPAEGSGQIAVKKEAEDTYTCTCPDGSQLSIDKDGNLVSNNSTTTTTK